MQITICAPTGSFKSVQTAAIGEKNLDWSSAIGREHDAATLCYAALEAAEHLERIPGITVKIMPFSGIAPRGPSITILSPAFLADKKGPLKIKGLPASPTEEQGFAIRTPVPGQYLILGGSRVGALYGTYELLSRLGFRWFSPDEWDTRIPAALPKILPRLNIQESPSFPSRGYWGVSGRGNNSYVRWMARNRLNLGAPKMDIPFCRKLGMKFFGGMHDDSAHYLDPKKYFKKHPEWYALKNGKRSANLSSWDADNFCFSNPEARAMFVKGVLEELIQGRYRWTDFFQVCTVDGGRWCECKPCKLMGNPTDHILALAHEVRQAILRARAEGRLHREVLVGVVAYMETKDPPLAKLPENFDHKGTFATFFPIERCYAHSFADRTCTEINVPIRTLYEGWTRNPKCVFKGKIGIGEYYNVSKFVGMSIPFIKRMTEDIPYFYKTGARLFCYMHPVVKNLGTLALTESQMAAQLWNHKTDSLAFLSRFLKERYGNEARDMEQFYLTLERAMSNAQVLRHQPNLEPGKNHLFHTLRIPGNPSAPVKYLRSRHLTLENNTRVENEGPSLIETLELLDKAEKILDKVLLNTREGEPVRKSLLADKRRFDYTKNVMNFTYHILRIRLFQNKGKEAFAALEARTLRDLGEALRLEDLIPHDGCQDSKILFQNGLYATYLSGPYKEIMKKYGIKVDKIVFDGIT